MLWFGYGLTVLPTGPYVRSLVPSVVMLIAGGVHKKGSLAGGISS